MSLTSYRAAPSRGKSGVVKEELFERWATAQNTIIYPSGRPGGDLLSRALRRSTIGSGGLNDRVRNGIGWGTSDIATRSTRRIDDCEKTLSVSAVAEKIV